MIKSKTRKKKKKLTLRQIRKKNHIHLNSQKRNEKKISSNVTKEYIPQNGGTNGVFAKWKDGFQTVAGTCKEKSKVLFEKSKTGVTSLVTKIKKKPETEGNAVVLEENVTNERPKAKKSTVVWASIVSVIVGLCVIVGCVCLKFGFDMLSTKPQLDVAKLRSPDSTVVLDKDDNVIAELGMYLRENIEFDDMPNSLIDAFLAIEDSRFFSHFGFDIPRFTMAALKNLRAGNFAEGGSTLTMQLIKNTYFQIDANDDSTMAERDGLAGIRRKLQEIVLSIELNFQISKEETFALFVNKINFGNNIRGVEKASEYYFGKSASELNLSESAFLAGIINSPNIYNPYNELYKHNESYIYLNENIEYLENATKRRNEVLDLMVHHGYISETEASLAKAIRMEDLLVGVSDKWSQTSEYYQSYIDAVIEEAHEKTGYDPIVEPMIIHTNMDPYMQKLVRDIQNNETDIKFRLDTMQSAIVVMNNQTGALIALGGGRDQNESRMFNRATSAKIQPGSTVKPIFEYALAFEKLGWATSHTITDKPIWLYNSNHLIRNAGGQGYTGDMLLTEAVARSLNTPAIQTLQAVIDEIGEEACVDYLRSIGFDVEYEDFDLQFAIGGNRFVTTPVEMGGAHAVLMNEGMYIEPHTINYIEFYDTKKENYVADVEGERALSAGAAYLAAYLEEYNVSGPFFNYMQILRSDYPVYAKTGTSDWGDSGLQYGIPRGAAKDSWLVAQTSDFTITIWIGFDKAAPGTYFTVYDDNQNVKGKIGRRILDELETHLEYGPHEMERPAEVESITHVKGLYPYCYPDRGTPVTGLILKDFNKLVSADTIKLETKPGIHTGMGGSIDDEGNYTIYWYGFGSGGGNGTMDISATNAYGKTEHAVGRCYYPRFVTTSPGWYSARILVDGSEVANVGSGSSSYSGHLDSFEPGKSVEVCGTTSFGGGEKCATIR